MPYKSEKQRRYMHAAAERGEIDKSVVEKFDHESRGMTLPHSSSTKKGAKPHGQKRSKDGKKPYPHKRSD